MATRRGDGGHPPPSDDESLVRDLLSFERRDGLTFTRPNDTPIRSRDPRDAMYPGGVAPDVVQKARLLEAGVTPRPAGRPKKGTEPPWIEIRNAFVFGMPYTGEDGNSYTHFPTPTELAQKFNLTLPNLRRRMDTEQWEMHKDRARQQVDAIVEDRMIEERVEQVMSGRQAVTSAAEHLLAQFFAAVKEGRFSIVTMKDFDAVARLYLRFTGEADRTHQHDHNHAVDLGSIQALHEESERRRRQVPSDFSIVGGKGLPHQPAMSIPMARPSVAEEAELIE
jgi:hypothetical protein